MVLSFLSICGGEKICNITLLSRLEIVGAEKARI